MKGWPIATLVRGRMVAKDGKVCAEPGWGQPVVQTMPPPQPRNLDKHLATLWRVACASPCVTEFRNRTSNGRLIQEFDERE